MRFVDEGRKKVYVAGIVALIVISAAVAAFFLCSGNDEPDVSLIDEKKQEYMLVNVPKDYEIEVTADTDISNYRLADWTGRAVRTKGRKVKDKIFGFAPEHGYEEGGVYFFDLHGKGVFTDERYKRARKIMLVIEKTKQKN